LGLPNIQVNNYIDTKNASELFIVDKSNENGRTNLAKFTDIDIMDFYFEDITSEKTGKSILIPFRANITSISDGTSADWTTNTYVGRPDKFYIYGGFDRRLGVSFEAAVNSKAELLTTWRKLNYLQGMCYPTSYPGNVSMTAPIMAVTIGALFERVFVVMNSISFDFDASTIWEIEKDAENNYQLPQIIKVTVDLNVLYDQLPIARTNHFAQDETWMNPILYEYKSQDKMLNKANDWKTIQSDRTRKKKIVPSANNSGRMEIQGA